METTSVRGVRLHEVLWQDSVGTVARAEDAATAEPLAVRRLHGHLCGDEGARLVFAEEVRRIATLRHPFLLSMRRHDANAAVPWMATDPVHGGTLAEAVAASRVAEADARAFALALLDASRLLEGRRQFHAAPIPARIVAVGGAWKLLTFRDVRAADEAPRTKGRAPADARWAAPETAADAPGTPTARTLLPWSVGALWAFLRTGHDPVALRAAAFAGLAGDEGRAIARLLDPEPLRRPAGHDACLALVRGGASPGPARGGA